MDIIIKIVLGFLGGILELIFIDLFFGGLKFIYNQFAKLFRNIFGIRAKDTRSEIEKLNERLEKKYLYKNITLTENLNSKLTKGLKGAILEIIDDENVFAEFYEQNTKKQIEYNNEIVFKVSLKKILVQN